MGKLINGKLIAEKVLKRNAKQIIQLKKQGIIPKLAVILVGADKPSQIYVNKKKEAAEKIGLGFVLYKIKSKITTEKLIEKVKKIQQDKDLSGIIIQLPLPKHIDTNLVLNHINPDIDVDFLSQTSQEQLKKGINKLLPPTPGAIMEILKEIKINPTGKNVVIIGKGVLVGKPLYHIMKHRGANITVCDSKTKNIKKKCLQADILITGVGKQNLVRGEMIKPDAIVIDAGTIFIKKKLYGDVNLAEVKTKAAYVTPTPGGVGPITVTLLLQNTIESAKNMSRAILTKTIKVDKIHPTD